MAKNIKKYKQNPTTKKVWIRYDEKTKSLAKEIQNKNHISLSTLCRILYKDTYNKIDKDKMNLLSSGYMNTEKMKYSYIKPRELVYGFEKPLQTNVFISNILFLYVNKKYDQIETDKEKRQKLLNKISNDLSKEKEVFWDLRNQIVSQYRAVKIIQESCKQE